MTSRRPPLSEGEKSQIVRLYIADGLSVHKVAGLLERDVGSVYKFLHRAGIPLRSAGEALARRRGNERLLAIRELEAALAVLKGSGLPGREAANP